MKNLRRLTVFLILTLFITACSDASAPEAGSKAPQNGMTFPAMDVAEFDAFLADNAGKPTMALFWTTWCPSCKQQIPEMEALYASHKDKLNILTISLDEDMTALDAFFEGKEFAMPVYHGSNALAERFNISAIPTLVIFNKKGEQTFGQAGVFPNSMLKAMADKLIAQ